MAVRDDAELWENLKKRDPQGRFIYAVLTTGIYCRPGCPSRLPRFENVRFFTSNEEAERAGFRACKRCKPDQTALDDQATAVARACRMIEEAEGLPDFEAIAHAVGMSRHHFHRVFKAFTGITPGQYSRSVKERAAVNGLARGETVTEAIYGAGYGSSSRFYEMLAPHLGMKPAAFAKGGAGERILFAVGQCFLGSILVAATGKGICAIEFGDDPETLIDDFQDRFAQAELIGGDPDFERLVAEVVGCVEQPFREFALPLHVRGTVFQHKVWRALREIPVGTTLSYAELAAKIGQPSAVRAVASACAKNKLAVAIPCHRVVRSSGALSGYRWKVDRKAALLAREAAS